KVKKMPWQEAPTDLKLASWLKNKKAAIESKSVKLEKGGMGGIETAFSKIADTSDAFDELLKDLAHAQAQFEKKTAKFQATLATYTSALAAVNAGAPLYDTAKTKATKAMTDYRAKPAAERDQKFIAEQKALLDGCISAADTLSKRTTDYEGKIGP